MKVIRLHNPNDMRLHDEPVPVPEAGETLVRVKAVGICGSDLLWYGKAGIGDARLEKPLILGHEFAGVIAEGPRKGERVAVDPAAPCYTSDFCLQGTPNLCEHLRFAGHDMEDGALREYLAWPTACLHSLPDSLTDADGVMLEPLGVAIHAVDLGKLQPGMTVGVFGCGPIGLLIIQIARLFGTQTLIATDIRSHCLDVAVGRPIPPVLTAICDEFGGPIPVGAYAKIGGDEIGQEIIHSIGNSPAILMKNHGVFTIGKTPQAAVKTAVMVEDVARTVFYALQLGQPEEIPEEEITRAHRRYLEDYGQ